MSFNTKVRGGNDNALFLIDGDLWGVGSSYDGNLGTLGLVGEADTQTRETPGQFTFTGDYIEVTTGESQVWGLKANGEVYGWGRNNNGGLTGVVGEEVNSTPTRVPSIPAMKQITGASHACAGLAENNTVWVWGCNPYIGMTGSAAYATYAKQVTGLPSNVKQILTNPESNNVMVLTDTDDLWIWGDNHYGACGDGTSNAVASYYVSPPRLLSSNVLDANCAAWGNYSVVLKKDHTLWFCGDSNDLIPGDNATHTTLIQIANVPANIIKITGSYWIYALTSTGEVWGWGANFYKQISDNDVTGIWRYAPSNALLLGTGILDIYQGGSAACLIQKTDGIYYAGVMWTPTAEETAPFSLLLADPSGAVVATTRRRLGFMI